MDKLLRERRGHVEIVTLNRPEVRNALDPELLTSLNSTFRAIGEDPDVRVAILTGAGDRAFCAGMDLKAFSDRGGARSKSVDDAPSFTEGFCPKPVIAAVNGAAVAGGFELVLACDLVVSARHAFFGIPEVKRGLIAAGGGLARLPTRVPLAVALELGLTGESIDAERAADLGLVNVVVPDERLMAMALDLAERICANAPRAVQASKRVMHAASRQAEDHARTVCTEESEHVFASEDALEGARAFVEKRTPLWTGR